MLCRSLAYGFTFTINKELNAIKEWVIVNHLSINTVKTQALVIGTSTYKYELWLGDTPVEIKDSLKILGVITGSNLTFEEHLKSQLNNAYAKTNALRRTRHFIPMHVMSQLHRAFVLPHLKYCAPILIGITNSLSDKLEDANYYVLRTLFRLPKSIKYNSILRLINTRTLE